MTYNSNFGQKDYNLSIKWSEALKNNLLRGIKLKFDKEKMITIPYRPFCNNIYYSEKNLSDRLTNNHYNFFGDKLNLSNLAINIMGITTNKPFSVLCSDKCTGVNYLSPAAGTYLFPLYFYDTDDNRVDNITNWGLKQFQEHYKNKKITKEDIFHYTYGVLHNPEYRKKYEINLKREFPRIPFYEDFKQWRDWGKDLMELHISFESAKPFGLKRIENKEQPRQRQGKSPANQLPESKQAKQTPKPRLKADRENGIIELDEQTILTGVPKEAWEYKLGNRSALEWVLDQYKEYKPSDPTIAEKFNTYFFADYKEKVIELLKRVCAVSVKTMEIIKQMD
jgi:predicted helicase